VIEVAMRTSTKRAVVIGIVLALVGAPSCSLKPDPPVDEEAVKDRLGEVTFGSLGPAEHAGDGISVPSATPPPERPEVQTAPDLTFDGGYFDTNSVALSEDGVRACEDAAQGLVDRTGYISFLGFADRRSTSYPGGNDALSSDRAATVANCFSLNLAAAGVDSLVVLEVRGLGDRCPRSEDPLAAENRRVEVYVTSERVTPVSDAC
jgi:outer membrane protein OmpA-like peptidoglycan-associated protein